VVQEAVTAESWVDLSLHIPPELLSKENDCRTLLLEHVLRDESNSGVIVLANDCALFMSRAMIQSVSETTIVPLIEPWAKRRAKELDAGEHSTSAGPPPAAPSREAKKAKRSSLPSSSKKVQVNPQSNEPSSDSMISLAEIVQAVIATHPDVAETCGGTAVADEGSALFQLCEVAFCTSSSLHSMCDRAVQAELKRLESERAFKVMIRRKESAAKAQDIQVSFEDPTCFPAACYMIQGFASFLEYAAEAREGEKKLVSEQVLNELKRDFLLGCGADFTRRVTLFCLFKNEQDEDIFSFEPLDSEATLVHYCSPVNLVTRQYPPVFLSSTAHDADDPKQQGPLAQLRSMLPSTVGTALARQWILCGAECYQGGAKPGSLEGFLAHIEENTLTICGLPFKRLDKKAKKQFLNTRRQHLVQALENETDPSACLDYAVMLLFQLVKNHVVFGSLLKGPVLHLLAKEKKIADDVSATLQSFADHLAKGEPIDSEMVERIKACSLRK
jgi:hypothetical protein